MKSGPRKCDAEMVQLPDGSSEEGAAFYSMTRNQATPHCFKSSFGPA